MPGCAFSVVVNSASGPPKHIAVRSYPSAALARSNQDFAAGKFSARSLPMPTTCAPCPANNSAVLLICGTGLNRKRPLEERHFPQKKGMHSDFRSATLRDLYDIWKKLDWWKK